jgi:hypothetical protein
LLAAIINLWQPTAGRNYRARRYLPVLSRAGDMLAEQDGHGIVLNLGGSSAGPVATQRHQQFPEVQEIGAT